VVEELHTGCCWVCGRQYDWTSPVCPGYCSQKCRDADADTLEILRTSTAHSAGDEQRMRNIAQRLRYWDARSSEPSNVRVHTYKRPKGWR